MNRTDVEHQLRRVREARETWGRAHTDFFVNVDRIMSRLIFEGLANRMSAEQVSSLSGMSVKHVRQLMRTYDLDPKQGKRLLSAKAAEALANNAALLGIEPSEMDLMSPLAYLPAGSELRKAMASQSVSQVTEVSGNDEWNNARVVFEFVSHMSAEYRQHSANAVREDMVVACARFGVDPVWFYDAPTEAIELQADVEAYKIRHGL